MWDSGDHCRDCWSWDSGHAGTVAPGSVLLCWMLRCSHKDWGTWACEESGDHRSVHDKAGVTEFQDLLVAEASCGYHCSDCSVVVTSQSCLHNCRVMPGRSEPGCCSASL